MRIYIAGPAGLDIRGMSPWTSLVGGLSTHHRIVSSLDTAQALVSINHQPSILKQAIAVGIPRYRRALIMLEPAATLPAHGLATRMASYAIVHCGSPHWAKAVSGEVFMWPQDLAPSYPAVNLGGTFAYRATMVAGQKRSAMRSSLYGLRRDVLRALGHERIPVGLAGGHWVESPLNWCHRSIRALAKAGLVDSANLSFRQAFGRVSLQGVEYVGPVGDKLEFMRKAPIAIVIENSPDYVSEKVVDAIRAGVAPVYVGPPLSDFDLPTAAVLPVSASARDVAQRVRDSTADELEKCISHGQKWLASQASHAHDSREVMRALGERIAARLTSNGTGQ